MRAILLPNAARQPANVFHGTGKTLGQTQPKAYESHPSERQIVAAPEKPVQPPGEGAKGKWRRQMARRQRPRNRLATANQSSFRRKPGVAGGAEPRPAHGRTTNDMTGPVHDNDRQRSPRTGHLAPSPTGRGL
ncbi:hypothetical protein Nepgr_025057 [Nepenthes gracilis]|uniref:Uncharacterized protein n=1 Tax=Nepenthes gracilis TaxID=150966 RepID=A0AAD3T5K2_NEPGR|nr:hypothetical protein Nepgr_025057 [Nepenthes gracilis]